MAAPSIVNTATTNWTSETTTPVVNLPSSIIAGNLLLAHIRVADAGGITWPAGWTELWESNADASNDEASMAWRKANGAEPATITLASGNAKFAAQAWQISGAADPTITPPVFAGPATGTSINPDPPSLTPPGGSQAFLWLAVGGWEGEQTSPPVGFPAGYTLNQMGASSGTAGGDTSNCRVASAAVQLTAATQDPGTFLISALDDWMATTVAIYPAPRRGLVHWVEFLSPDGPRQGIAYFSELETPTPPRTGRVYFAEFENPAAPRRGLIYFVEVETEDPPRRGRLYMAHLQTPPGSSAPDGDNDSFLILLDRRDGGVRRIKL